MQLGKKQTSCQEGLKTALREESISPIITRNLMQVMHRQAVIKYQRLSYKILKIVY